MNYIAIYYLLFVAVIAAFSFSNIKHLLRTKIHPSKSKKLTLFTAICALLFGAVVTAAGKALFH